MEFNITRKTTPTFYFIGVTTTQSSIMKVFPIWANALGRSEVVIEGVNIAIHGTPEAYRQVVAQIKYDPNSLGALVTTHKIDLLTATRDMFGYLDPYAALCNEVSCISKQEGRLEGHAKDPITSGLSLDNIIGEGYFGRTHGEVLCFGAGGSGVATALHLIKKQNSADRPSRMVIVNRSQGRLDNLKKMVNEQQTDIQFEYVCCSKPEENDKWLAKMPAYSVIINATGMGKDTPGSPISNNGIFPTNSIAWEFNYRGELDFMHQALKQQKARNLVIEDGWLYFIHGWTQVITQVLHIDLTMERVDQLAKLAEIVRPAKVAGLRR
jgi:shikimate dehydrogenase